LGENPEYYESLQKKWNDGNFFILMGMQQDVQQRPIYKTFEETTPSRHLTIVFNLFVFMQIFNMICSRKINDQVNIFEGITSNPAFLVVWVIILIVQICCCQLFGRFVSVHINGLTATQWILCIVVALITFPINLLLKYCPDSICPVLGDEDPADVESAAADYKELRDRAEKNASL
jgi:magnesium-transporting ATPase (P-type)